MKLLQLSILVFLAITFISCDKDDDGGTPLSTVVLTGTETSSRTLSKIFETSTPDYRVEGSYVIQAGVTIEPGVIIEMGPNANIIVEGAGFLNASGNESNPIVIAGQSNTPGYWEYIRFTSNNNNNLLNHVIIRDGGGNNSWDAAVYCYLGGRLRISNTSIVNSARNGMVIFSPDFSLDDFRNNIFSNNASFPLSITQNQADKIDGNSLFTGNSNNQIELRAGVVGQNTSWKNTGIPYFASSSINLEANLTLEPGVRINMAPNTNIVVEQSGSLRAVGTPSNRITITGDQPTKGYWDSIRFVGSNSNQNEFRYVDVSYGGGNSSWDAAVYLWNNSRLSMGNSSISNSQRWGMIVPSGNTFVDEGGNEFFGNDGGDIGG